MYRSPRGQETQAADHSLHRDVGVVPFPAFLIATAQKIGYNSSQNNFCSAFMKKRIRFTFGRVFRMRFFMPFCKQLIIILINCATLRLRVSCPEASSCNSCIEPSDHSLISSWDSSYYPADRQTKGGRRLRVCFLRTTHSSMAEIGSTACYANFWSWFMMVCGTSAFVTPFRDTRANH